MERSPKRQRRSLSPDSSLHPSGPQQDAVKDMAQSGQLLPSGRSDSPQHVSSTTAAMPVNASATMSSVPGQASQHFGTAALICQTAHPCSAPHPSQDLIKLYNTSKIASSVARKDPLTGEKINKLRKSYEGKLKSLGLPGRNRPTEQPRALLGLLDMPDDVWEDQYVRGKDLSATVANGELAAKLERALDMQSGQLPTREHEKWKGILALDEIRSPLPQSQRSTTSVPTLRTQLDTVRDGGSRPASPLSAGSARPERANKKRRYDDASFEGYAEGYQDDNIFSHGAADDRRNSASRKRRREQSQGGYEPGSASHLGDTNNYQFGQSPNNLVGVKL